MLYDLVVLSSHRRVFRIDILEMHFMMKWALDAMLEHSIPYDVFNTPVIVRRTGPISVSTLRIDFVVLELSSVLKPM